MDGRRVWSRCGLGPILFTLGFASCAPKVAVEDLPGPEATLAAVGVRLSRSLSAGALTALSARGDRVLAALTPAERDALGRGHLRFRIDRTAEVYVAAPRGHGLFWLGDQGFRPAGTSVVAGGSTWTVSRKRFPAGWVGLGVNGLDRTTSAHYAVFVRPAGVGPVTVRVDDRAAWQAVPAAVGVSLESGVGRALTDLPGLLAGSTLLRSRHDLRHASALARGRVWKTHTPSGPAPDQVALSFGADPSTELTWTWRTAATAGGSVVRVRPAGVADAPERRFRGGSEAVALPDLLNDPVIRRHAVRASGLTPGTAYEYTVGDGPPSWTEVRTPPRGGADVCLLYMGDPQCGLEGWGELLASARRRRPDASAILIAGDLVDRGNERTNWDHFFLRASGVFERLPVMPCVGNHEYLDRGPWLFRAFFALPENGPVGIGSDLAYHFEVGDAFVAVLDSTLAVSDPAQARRQADWLDRRLAETRRAWKLVMFHHPVYASHPWRESPALRDAWVPVFDRHGVDLVLQGHDHAYLRTYPMRAGRRAPTPAEGTVYVVSVSGDKYCDQNPRGVAEVGFTRVSTYQTIDLLAADRRLVYRAFDRGGRERDRFTLDKPRPPAAVARR